VLVLRRPRPRSSIERSIVRRIIAPAPIGRAGGSRLAAERGWADSDRGAADRMVEGAQNSGSAREMSTRGAGGRAGRRLPRILRPRGESRLSA
jgi:hypothetical protein